MIHRFAVSTRIPKLDLTIVNVHLEPGKTGSHKRLTSLQEISNRCETKGLVIVGDTNTRVSEEADFEKNGLVGVRPPMVTWDSRKNRFRKSGNEYSAYYTRYFHNEHVEVSNVKVWDKPCTVDGNEFYLSDHFAMTGEIKLKSQK